MIKKICTYLLFGFTVTAHILWASNSSSQDTDNTLPNYVISHKNSTNQSIAPFHTAKKSAIHPFIAKQLSQTNKNKKLEQEINIDPWIAQQAQTLKQITMHATINAGQVQQINSILQQLLVSEHAQTPLFQIASHADILTIQEAFLNILLAREQHEENDAKKRNIKKQIIAYYDETFPRHKFHEMYGNDYKESQQFNAAQACAKMLSSSSLDELSLEKINALAQKSINAVTDKWYSLLKIMGGEIES